MFVYLLNYTNLVFQAVETQMALKAKQVTELKDQAEYLERLSPEKTTDIESKKAYVEERLISFDIFFFVKKKILSFSSSFLFNYLNEI